MYYPPTYKKGMLVRFVNDAWNPIILHTVDMNAGISAPGVRKDIPVGTMALVVGEINEGSSIVLCILPTGEMSCWGPEQLNAGWRVVEEPVDA
jgi:hypothetical protein